jgi:hypothetical protein
MTTFDRFKIAFDFLQKHGVFKSKAELARQLNRGYAGVVSACNGKAPEFNRSFLADFAKKFSISQSWLLTGEGEMLGQSTPSTPSTLTSVNVPSSLLESLYSELHSLREEVAALNRRMADLEAKRTAPHSVSPLSMVADT